MRTLGQIIDEAVKQQYGDSTKPHPLSIADKVPDRQKYSREFLVQIKNAGLQEPASEYRFHPVRLWRLDFAYPEKKIAIEIDGGGWGRPVFCNRCRQPVTRFVNGRSYPVREGGRHHTAKGAENDNEKKNTLAEMGWRVLTFNPKHIREKSAIESLKKLIGEP
jgi:very-short-patch-repair endonuclease